MRNTSILQFFFGKDPRVELIHQDAAFWIDFNKNNQFDLIFADTWVGKFTHLDLVLAMVKPGGFYVVDDLNRQLNWPEGHQDQVILLFDKLKSQKDFYAFPIDMGTSLFVLCRKRA
jgi:predicted O-methyltransferase YrrM